MHLLSMEMSPLPEEYSTSGTGSYYNVNLSSDNWSTNDVLIWIKSIKNGLISERYSMALNKIKDLKITGSELQSLNEFNLKAWGISDALHRAIIMTAISSLDVSITDPEHDPITLELSAILDEEISDLRKSNANHLYQVGNQLFVDNVLPNDSNQSKYAANGCKDPEHDNRDDLMIEDDEKQDHLHQRFVFLYTV